MVNSELSQVFERIADLLEIDGADGFRVNSYRRAGRTIKELAEDVAVVSEQGRLTELPGIGKGMAQRIEQFLETGTIDVLTELEAKLPEGLPALLEIQGMGPKKVALAHNELGVADTEDLKRVIASGELAALPGLGPKSVEKIAEGIEFLEKSGERTPRGIALPIAEELAERVRALPGVKRVEIAGSLRRGTETIGDIDLLCVAADGEKVVEAFVAFDGVKRILASGSTKGSVTVGVRRGRELQIDLRVVPAESFGAAWQYFTGSKEHNVRLREMAVKRKWRLNEYGMFDDRHDAGPPGKPIAGRREEDIYQKLGLPWIPPELRQDRDEFAPDADFSKLVTVSDIRGDLHVHSTASDGRNTIKEMALAAKKLGYKYLAICDHSASATIANGLSIERMWEHVAAIRKVDEETKGIKVFAGTECDILPDGSLDYPDDLLAECEVVAASIHLAMSKGGRGKASPTERTIAAIENPYVIMIGHPTGRLLGTRPPMDIDMTAIIEAAARTGTMLEVNASWQRLDLMDAHIRQAREAGVILSINTDAHGIAGLDDIHYGVTTARRGLATTKDIANCFPLAKLRKCLARKRASDQLSASS